MTWVVQSSIPNGEGMPPVPDPVPAPPPPPEPPPDPSA